MFIVYPGSYNNYNYNQNYDLLDLLIRGLKYNFSDNTETEEILRDEYILTEPDKILSHICEEYTN